MLSADHIHGHAYPRVGHKGLIFDRLDVGVADRGDDGTFTAGQFVGHPGCDFDTPRIVPFARGFYHNRNRVYMPELGRFAQADPNASGQTVLSLPVYHGRAIGAGSISFSLQSRYGDGGSLFGYMGGNPWMRSDEMGLFFNPTDIAGAVLMGGIRMLKGGLENMIGTYGSNTEMDFEWAMDWSLHDDFHKRSTVRMNQALVLNGQVISNLRPDLQYVLRPPNQTPRLVVVEVGLSNTAHPSKWDHMRELVKSMGYILDVVVDNSLQK